MSHTADIMVKTDDIVRDEDFKQINEVRVDAQGRIPIGKLQVCGPNGDVTLYRVYRNSFGQIILDPHVTVPAHEVWFLKNPQAMKMVAEGWKEAHEGKLIDSREDYTKYADDDADQ